MKKIYAALTLLALFVIPLAGCGPGTDGTDTATGGGDTADEPAETQKGQQPQQKKQETQGDEGTGGYFGAVNKARRSATETAALTKLKQEIRRFKALKGRNPRSLDELEKWRGSSLPEPPKGRSYSYDPETGELSLEGSR